MRLRLAPFRAASSPRTATGRQAADSPATGRQAAGGPGAAGASATGARPRTAGRLFLRGLASLAVFGVSTLSVVPAALIPAKPAAAAGSDCVVVGYTTSPDKADALRATLRNGSVADGGGVQLNNQSAWQVKPGEELIVAVTALDATAKPVITSYVGGLATSTTVAGSDAGGRVVSGPLSVDPGTVTGTVGIRIGGDCPAQDVLVRAEQTALVDVVGGVGLAVTVIFGFLLVFLARRRTGGWLRRAATALVPGLLTGLGEAATLYDTGVAKPFAAGWWGLAGAGVALALLLPLTRLRRRRAAAPAPAFPGAPAPLPDLGRYIPETLFARTAAGTVYRAFDPATQQRVLLKVAHPEPLTVPVPLPGAPVSTVPGSGAPAPGMPISAVPGPVIPGQFVPGQFVPGQLNPVSGMPVSGVPGYGPPGAPMSAPPGFPAPGYPAPGYPVSGVPGYPTGAFPVPGYPTGGFPAPGYPPPGSAAPGYPVPGSPAPTFPLPGFPGPGSSPLGFPAPGSPAPGSPAPGSPAPGLPTSAIPAQGGAAPVSGVPVSVPPTFPGPVSAIPDAAQPVGAQAVPTEGPAGTPAEAPVATPAAGQPSPTDETARLDPPATSGAVPEPDRGPSAPVEYLVPGLGTGPTTAAQPATGSGTQLTLTQQRFLRDADVMRRLDNPNCLHARDAFGPVVVTDYVDGMPLRQVLAEKGRLTGPQAMVVLAGALRGLGAVHDLGLVHRDVTPPNIYLDQSGRAVLADFESAAPGTEPVPAAAESAVYLSPEQRSGAVLDARSDLFTVGLVLAELLTGEVPVVSAEVPPPPSWQALHPALVALLHWMLALDPAGRPANAPELLVEWERAATTAFGADWVTLGAVTGAILVPAGVVAAVTAGVAGAGVAATGVGGLASGAAVGTGGLAAGTAQTGLNVVVNAGTQTTVAASRGVLSFAPAVVGAVVAAAIAITASTTPAKPKPVAQDRLTASVATVILTKTFGEAQHDNTDHVGPAADRTLDQLFQVGGAKSGTLSNIQVKLTQPLGYPAAFDATAEEKLADGSTAYLYVHFDRASADQPWKLNTSYYSLDADTRPTLDIQELVIDPTTIPGLYQTWLARALAQHSVGSDSQLVLDGANSDRSALSLAANFGNQVRNDSFYEAITPLGVTDFNGPVFFRGGVVQATFVVRLRDDFYNRPGTYSGDCSQYQVFWNQEFDPTLPGGYFRELHGVLVATVVATIPTKKSGGKVSIDDTKLSVENPTGVPC